MSISKIPFPPGKASHKEWIETRKNYIGGSDAAAVVGLNPFKSPFSLWAEKTGKLPPFEGNITTRVGNELENFVAELFTEETGLKVRRNNHMLINSDYPFACADIDREIIGSRALLECKTTTSFSNLKMFKGGEYPAQWYCQVMHYMAVTGADKAYIAAIANCRDFHIWEVERDESEISALMDAERKFFEKYISADVPPDTDGSTSTSEAIKEIFKESNDEIVTLFGLDSELEQYEALGRQIDGLKKNRDEIGNRIKAEIGNGAGAETDYYSISYRPQTRRTFDEKSFSAAYPEINLSGFFRETSSKVLRIRARKED